MIGESYNVCVPFYNKHTLNTLFSPFVYFTCYYFILRDWIIDSNRIVLPKNIYHLYYNQKCILNLFYFQNSVEKNTRLTKSHIALLINFNDFLQFEIGTEQIRYVILHSPRSKSLEHNSINA